VTKPKRRREIVIGAVGLLLLVVVIAALSRRAANVGSTVKVRTLSQEDARLLQPFVRVSDLFELSDGRVVIVDANDQAVYIGNFRDSSVHLIGRNGSGPIEYLLPSRLLRLGGDSVGIVDVGNSRILVVKSDGHIDGVLGLDQTNQSHGPSESGPAAEAGDEAGNLYSIGPVTTPSASLRTADSAPIVRWRIGESTRDTIAYLPLPPGGAHVLVPGEGTAAFVVDPQWAVGPKGELAIIFVSPYSVDVIQPGGTRAKGGPIPFRRTAVTEEDKRQWSDQRSRPRLVIITPPGAQASPSAGLRVIPSLEPVRWPAYLPPFLEEAGRFAPDGRLWIQRATHPDEQNALDIIDRSGLLVEQVFTPAMTRLVGFGKSHLYFAQADSDGQERLERYRLERTLPMTE
jgi:hypothetical protein